LLKLRLTSPLTRRKEWDNTNDIIKEIEAQTKDRPELFAYQKYNTQIRYALILVDNKWAWWTPYHPGIDVVSAKGVRHEFQRIGIPIKLGSVWKALLTACKRA